MKVKVEVGLKFYILSIFYPILG